MWIRGSDRVFDYLLGVREEKGAGYIVLIDPDRKNADTIDQRVDAANEQGVDAIFVGGSLMMDGRQHERVKGIVSRSRIPVILFPGGVNQLNPYYDAMLFMSILSGRNPQYLVGEQVVAAPLVKDYGLETIATGYLLIDGGNRTTVEYMSGTTPIPADRPDIVVAHGLAAQFLGMALVYLETGSGASQPVQVETIRRTREALDIPIVAGGGIRTPEAALERVRAGADFIVTGTVFEETSGTELMADFSSAIHWKTR